MSTKRQPERREGTDYEVRGGVVVWYLVCPTSGKSVKVCGCLYCQEWQIIEAYQAAIKPQVQGERK